MYAKPSILIVDDEDINRSILEDILCDDYTIYQAANGKEAVDFLEAKKHYIQLILLDINMPMMSGFDVLKRIKAEDGIKDIPVIIISSDSAIDTITAAYKLGAVDYFGKPFIVDIVRRCVSNTIEMATREYIDSVTGGYNRRGFERGIESFLSTVPDKSKFALIFYNIKNFKALSEMFRGSSGNDLVHNFYKSLVDTKPLALSRLELDHFAMLVPNDKAALEERFSQMHYLWNYGDKKVRVYYQAGIYIPKGEDTSISVMLERARMACESIEDEYTSSYAYYDSVIAQKYIDQADVLARFDEAIKNKEFLVYYQPVIDVKNDSLVSAEALVRWVNSEKGVVSPGVFIPVLEKDGYISELDNYVIETVYRDIEERMKNNSVLIPISINLSWMDFYDDHIQNTIKHYIETKPEATKYVRYEVTETSIAALSNSNSREILRFIKDNAIKILIDDFGSGYSSFSVLNKYDFDILKIDMSLTKQITYNPKMKAIILCIIHMCHEIGIKVLAEGVEKEEEVVFLKENNCDFIQGYYYSKPLPKADFIKFVEKK